MALTKVDTQLLSNGFTTDSTGLNTISGGNTKILATAAGTSNDRKLIFQNELGTQATLAMGTTGSSGGVNKFYVQTNAGYSLTVDASGYVNMPYQPASLVTFTAGAPTSWSSDVVIVFDAVDSANNVASMYSTSNGRFTAPVAGWYNIHCTMMIGTPETNTNRMVLKKNGGDYKAASAGQDVIQSALQVQGIGNKQSNVMLSAIVKLAAGDYLQFACRSGAVVGPTLSLIHI